VSRQRALQSTAPDSEQADRRAHVSGQESDVPLRQKVYLTSLQAVEYLELPSLNALQQRMKRRSIPTWTWTRMGGKSLRFVRASLDEWLQKRHGATTVTDIAGRR
jgi:hypothetical protein